MIPETFNLMTINLIINQDKVKLGIILLREFHQVNRIQ